MNRHTAERQRATQRNGQKVTAKGGAKHGKMGGFWGVRGGSSLGRVRRENSIRRQTNVFPRRI